MPGVSDFLFGKGQSVKAAPPEATQSRLDPSQVSIEGLLATLLGQPGGLAGPGGYTGQLTAPLDPLQTSALSGFGSEIFPLANNAASSAFGTVTGGNNALQAILAQGPDFSAKTFDAAVAQPLMKNFSERVLPSLASAYGANAGGIRSSDYMKGVSQSTEDLNRTLASSASNFAMQNEGNILSAAGMVPGMASLPGQLLSGILQAGGVPQQNAQAGLTNSYLEFQRMQGQQNTWINQMLTMLGLPTTSVNAIVNPGSPGLIQGLLGNSGLGAAAGAAMFMSSEEFKDVTGEVDEKKILRAIEKMPVKKWKYKGDTVEHLGPMAEAFSDLLGLENSPRKVIHVQDAVGTLLVGQKALLRELKKLKKAA